MYLNLIALPFVFNNSIMSIVKAVFTQLINNSKPLEKISIEVSKETDSKKRIETFVGWASKQLAISIKNSNKYSLEKFDLRKPIFADIFLDSELKLKLIQIRAINDTIIRKNSYPYKIGLSTYLLIPRNYYRPSEKQRKVVNNKKGLRNADKYISATNAHIRVEKKISSPVIYTAWTK
jgi:hypothetical protein